MPPDPSPLAVAKKSPAMEEKSFMLPSSNLQHGGAGTQEVEDDPPGAVAAVQGDDTGSVTTFPQVVQMMEKGSLFTGYFEYQGEAIKQEFYVLYRRESAGPGTLYWCEPGNIVESTDCCLPLRQVADMYLGKHTKVLPIMSYSDVFHTSVMPTRFKSYFISAQTIALRHSWLSIDLHLLGFSVKSGGQCYSKEVFLYIFERQNASKLRGQVCRAEGSLG